MRKWADATCLQNGQKTLTRKIFVKPPTIRKGQRSLVIKTAIDRLLHLADSYYESGQRGLVYLPLRAHIAIAVAANVYRAIGQKLRRRQLDWTKGRVVTNSAEKTFASLTASVSLAARTRRKPFYQAGLQSALKDYFKGQDYPGGQEYPGADR